MIIFIGFAISLLVFFVFFWIFSKAGTRQTTTLAAASLAVTQANKTFSISSKDIETIAGDDPINTQLDLARAYLETDRKNLAKSILTSVSEHGSALQKQEARDLLVILTGSS